jgi:hypothetical protein
MQPAAFPAMPAAAARAVAAVSNQNQQHQMDRPTHQEPPQQNQQQHQQQQDCFHLADQQPPVSLSEVLLGLCDAGLSSDGAEAELQRLLAAVGLKRLL